MTSGSLTSTYTSPMNMFGIYRVYSCGAPSYTPNDNFSVEDIVDNPNFVQLPSVPHTAPSLTPFNITLVHEPLNSYNNPISAQHFENPSVFRLMLWYHNGALTKSLNDLNVLEQNVICAPDFQVEHFNNFDTAKAAEKLIEHGEAGPSGASLNDGWYESSVPITLACDRVAHRSEGAAPTLSVAGLYHQKPLPCYQGCPPGIKWTAISHCII
ncbi:hypothetical protein EI94DRAFT_1911832 [Lactarius quietus]|nr:hypothetical protein EI94DRAFT_1911832 [Lactarius quietus]